RVVVRLEEVDLDNRRMSFVLESNHERRVVKTGRRRAGSRQGWRRRSAFDPFDPASFDGADFDEDEFDDDY
ncbi:MAG: hypothetical protein ACI4SY_00045, partial [Sutterella sp.]